ncbi:serine hydrolase FSH [Usnea florida]
MATGRTMRYSNSTTTALRYELADGHTFDFVEGSLPSPMAPEIHPFFPADGQYFKYFDLDSAESMRKALSDLERYVEEEGPFDGVMAFSVGGTLAAALIISKLIKYQGRNNPLPFKCALFLSSGAPFDPAAALRDDIRNISPTEGELIQIPTAHIWGSNDELARSTSVVLSDLCDRRLKTVFVHHLGHDVPGAGSHQALNGAVRAIRRTIDKSESAGACRRLSTSS